MQLGKCMQDNSVHALNHIAINSGPRKT